MSCGLCGLRICGLIRGDGDFPRWKSCVGTTCGLCRYRQRFPRWKMELRFCRACSDTKPIGKFALMYTKNRDPTARRHICTSCRHKRKAQRRKLRGRCRRCPNPIHKGGYCVTCYEINKARVVQRRRATRIEVLTHYCGGPPQCQCCTEPRYEFLALDHINGGGNQHRKTRATHQNNLAEWLKKNNFPPGYRVLCHNCNMARGAFGQCPHERERLTPGSAPAQAVAPPPH